MADLSGTTSNKLVKYVRDENGHRIGLIVATSKNNIGWSSRNKKDAWDSKKAYLIANNRAAKGWKAVPPKAIAEAIAKMQDRASRYFDNPNPKHGKRAVAN